MKKPLPFVILTLSVVLGACGQQNTSSVSSPSAESISTTTSGSDLEFKSIQDLVNSGYLDSFPPEVRKTYEAYANLENKYGGLKGLATTYDTMSSTQKLNLLRSNNIIQQDESIVSQNNNSALEDTITAQAKEADGLNDCSRIFNKNLWNQKFRKNYGQYDIDGSGRPYQGLIQYSPIIDLGRNGYCQGKVGNFGNTDEGVKRRYDGGHLVPSALGGWYARLNLVPQQAQLNQEVVSTIETQATKCPSPFPLANTWQTTAIYRNSTTIIPSTFMFRVVIVDATRIRTKDWFFYNESPDTVRPPDSSHRTKWTARGEGRNIVTALTNLGCKR